MQPVETKFLDILLEKRFGNNVTFLEITMLLIFILTIGALRPPIWGAILILIVLILSGSAFFIKAKKTKTDKIDKTDVIASSLNIAFAISVSIYFLLVISTSFTPPILSLLITLSFFPIFFLLI